jgi:protein O-mannosyl-transferase
MKNVTNFFARKKFFFFAIGITFFVHLIYLKAGFVWVDHHDIEEKYAVVALSDIGKTFLTQFGDTSFYRPLVVILNSIDFALYGMEPFGYHLTNLLLHIGVVVAAGLFLKLMLNLKDEEVFLSRVFIGVHPMSILIVGAITRRQETLAAIFIFCAGVSYIYARKTGLFKYTILFLVTFFLALLAKETSLVITPALTLLWELSQKSRNVKNALLSSVWYGIPIVVYGFLRTRAVPQVWGINAPSLGLSEYLGTRIGLLGKWFWYAISPVKPPLTDAVPRLYLTSPVVFTSILLLLVLFVYILRKGWKDKTSLALLMTFIFIAPGIAIIPVPRIGTPNYGYLPAIGFAGLATLLWKQSTNKYATHIISVWIIVAAVLTFVAGDRFKNDQTLFKPEVADTYFPEAHYFLGNYHLKGQEYDLAQAEYKKSLEKDDSFIAFRSDIPTKINMASVTMQLGENEKARNLFQEVLDVSEESGKPLILFNIALTYYNEARYQDTINILESYEWDIKNAYIMLSESYKIQGKIKQSEEAIMKANSLQ